MRIALVAYDFPEYCIRHANAMSVEHEVLLLLPGNVAEEHHHLIDSAVQYDPFHRPRYRQPRWQLATIRQILRAIGSFDPDVVHFQNGHPYFNLALRRLSGYPLVITIHDPRQHLGDHESRLTPQFLMDYGFRQADRVIVHGTELKPIVVDRLGFDEHQVHVIPHVAIGQRDTIAPVSDAGDTLLFFGRIWEYKGLRYLIQAEPLISAQFPDLRIVVAGQGEDFDRYRRLMSHPERFEVHNTWISEDQRAQLFAAASVVVLPYIEATQSGVIPVAYSFAKPVIATRTGGLPDMVEHGKTGFLIPPRDSDALAAAAIELLGDQPKRLAMGRAGKEKLIRECAAEVVVRQTLEVYRGAIGNRSSGDQARRSTVTTFSGPASTASTPTRRLREARGFEESATRIHHFLLHRYESGGALLGPDPGVRFNYRIWRFLKSYLPRFRWNDDLYYLQAQGYWILVNWMFSQSDRDRFALLALRAADHVIERQRGDGAWDYPNPEWAGRVATVEGIWASLGLLECFRHSADPRFLEAALRWHRFFIEQIGFQEFDGMIAVNYFAGSVDEPVPNNSALALRYLAKLATATGDATYLSRCDGLLHFISAAQLSSGEVPYIYGDSRMVHFQCFQYQAFLYLDLLEYFRATQDPRAREVLVRVLRFLEQGIAPEGFAYYQCGARRRTVNYHTGAVAAALATANELGVPDHGATADRAYQYLLAQQRADGSVPHSRGDYGILADHRAYPRYLAMMAFHLLQRAGRQCGAPTDAKEDARVARTSLEGSV